MNDMFSHPYFLLFLLLLLLFIFLRERRYFFRHGYVKSLSGTYGWRWLKDLLVYFAFIFLVLAAVEPKVSLIETQKKLLAHKYVLINDGSGSMVDSTKKNGIGLALGTVYNGNKKLLDILGNRTDGTKDLIGAIVFSDNAFIISHLIDDPQFIAKKLSYIDYTKLPMGSGTELDRALWSGIHMVLSGKTEVNDDMWKIQTRMYGFGYRIQKDEVVNRIAEKYRNAARGASLVVFTDGEFSNPAGAPAIMSCFKIIDFCKEIGIRIYVISVEQIEDKIQTFCQETGGQGVVIKNYDQQRFDKVYADIVSGQANEYIIQNIELDKFLSLMLGAIGFSLFVIHVVISNTFCRVFTEV